LTYLFEILLFVINITWWVIVIQAILSWLIAFNVINTSNGAVRQIWSALERMTEPLYRPIRRILPDFGALDLSPLVVLLLIGLVDRLLRIAYMQHQVSGAA
jgi:YggT family protein